MIDFIGGISEKGCIYNGISKKICIRGWFYPSNLYDQIQVYYNNYKIGKCNVHMASPDVYKNIKKDGAEECRFSYESQIEMNSHDLNFMLVVKMQEKTVAVRIVEAQLASYKSMIESKAAVLHLKKQLDLGGGIGDDNWYDICSCLMGKGKKFMDDFQPIWAEYFIQEGIFRLDLLFPDIVTEDNMDHYFKVIKDRYKIIVLYGNCQIYTIGKMLAMEENIRKDYLIIRTPAVFDITGQWRKAIRKIFWYADIFTYQRVKNDNKWGVWAGTDYILTGLSVGCQKINIPAAYFTGYFPGYYKGPVENSLMPYRDRFIDEMIMLSCTELLKVGCQLSTKNVLENAEKSIMELRHREQNCDIKISDFIEKRWRKEQLFYTVNHLSKSLYREVCRLLLEFIGIINTNYLGEVAEQNGIMQLIWPCVEEVLEFRQENLYFNKTKDDCKYNKQEWIKKYIGLYT